MISHDWPEGVYNHGNTAALLRQKRHFADEVAAGALGNPASRALLSTMQPRYWFAGHLHVKFSAIVAHGQATGPTPTDSKVDTSTTRFLALDKCLPGHDFFQVLDVPVRSSTSAESDETGIARREAGAGGGLCYDPEWLAITIKTHSLLPTTKRYAQLPLVTPVSERELAAVVRHVESTATVRGAAAAAWSVPSNFSATVVPFAGGRMRPAGMPPRRGNPQTDEFLAFLGLPHVVTQPMDGGSSTTPDNRSAHMESLGGLSGYGAASRVVDSYQTHIAARKAHLLPSQCRSHVASQELGMESRPSPVSKPVTDDARGSANDEMHNADAADPAEIAIDAVPDAAEIDLGI